MSMTFRIVDGQVEFDPATGQVVTVSGERKCSQDLAEVLLQEYLPEQNYGSFLSKVIKNQIPYISELIIRHYISEAVRLLDAKQAEDPEIDSYERITGITQLDTILDDEGTLGFYVKVGTEEGEADAAVIKPTALNHLTEEL